MTYVMRTYLHTPVKLQGDHYEIGYQLGEQTAEWLQGEEGIRRNRRVDRPDSWPEPEGYTVENYKLKEPERFAEWDAMTRGLPKWMTDEMRGVSDGAKIPYQRVLIETAMFPLMFGGSHQEAPALTDDCNGFVAFGPATLGGRTIVAGNSEGDTSGRRRMNVYSVNNPKGISYVIAHSNPGCIGGRAGINEHGLAIWGNGISAPPEEYGYVGYDHHITRRTVLETCSNVDEAIKCLKNQKRLGASRVFLGDHERGAVVEYTNKHIEVIEPECGYQAGASPGFSNPKMAPYHYVLYDETDPKFTFHLAGKKSVFTIERYHELIKQQNGRLTPEMVPLLCGDHGGRGTRVVHNYLDGAIPQGSDYTCCIHGRKEGNVYHASAFGVLLVPDQKKLYVSWGSPCQAEYVGFPVPT